MTHPTLPTECLDERLAIVGTSGAGKTFAAKGFVERLLIDKARTCVIDPLGVWYGLRSSADGKSEGFPVVIMGGDHADVPMLDTAGEAVGELIAGTDMASIVDVSAFSMAGRRRFMTAFLESLYHRNRATLNLVVDEADIFAPQNPGPDGMTLLGRMEEVVRRGRVRGFIPWLITQRPAVLNKNVLSQADVMIAMKLTSPQDRDALGAWIEGQADKAEGKKLLAELPKLARGEGYVWAPAHRLLARTRFPAIATFDSSRTPKRGEKIEGPTRLAKVDLAEIRERLARQDLPPPKRAEKLASPALADAEAIKRAEAAAFEKGRMQGRAERDDEVRALQSSIRAALGYLAPMLPGSDAPDGILIEARDADMPVLKAGHPPPSKVIEYRPLAPSSAERLKHAAHSAPKTKADGLSGPQQRILDALAWLQAVGIERADRVRTAMLADQSHRSSGFEKNVSTLKTRELIAFPASGFLALTQAGALVANRPDFAMTTAELQAAIRRKVSGPQWRILEALIAVYPRELSREDAAFRADQSPKSSGFEKNVSTLRSLGFIDYPARGELAAQPILFIGEKK